MTVPRLRRGDLVLLATRNPGKIAELTQPLQAAGLRVIDSLAKGLPAPAETGADFRANAAIKATEVARATGMAALADDSGFEVAALDGAPGVLSARWMEAEGGPLGAMRRVHTGASDHPDRRARFTCVLAVGWPTGEVTFFEGAVSGLWVWPPRGEHGFGYDPIFQPEGSGRTFGELSAGEKEAVSHRARALASLVDWVLA